jgi:hypothetical protein
MCLQKVALLDDGVDLELNGELPKFANGDAHYCIYYRIAVDHHSCGTQYIYDWTGEGLTPNTDTLIAFMLKNKNG